MALMLCFSATAQIDAGLFRFPDVSKTQIVFSYGNDIWIIPKSGGTAEKLSSPAGVESFPKFSPDGRTVAFSGNYDGNSEGYLRDFINIAGRQLTLMFNHTEGYPKTRLMVFGGAKDARGFMQWARHTRSLQMFGTAPTRRFPLKISIKIRR